MKTETIPETTEVTEKAMCTCKKFGRLKFQPDSTNAPIDKAFTGFGHTLNNLPSVKENLLKIPQNIYTRKTLLEMYTDIYFKCKQNKKRVLLYNVSETTGGDFVDAVSFDEPASNTSISGRSTLFEALIFILCISVVISNSRCTYTTKCDRIFERDDAISTLKENIDNVDKQIRFKFLNIFYHIPRVSVYMYPFSLTQYANDVVKNQITVEELMKYEWSRYLSFKNFPMDCPMMPMRLAQAGFYYTGHGQEVKCFSCRITNCDWSVDETAVEVHKRLSPGCQFIRGENTDNVEIHAKEYYSGMFDVASYYGDSGQRPAWSSSLNPASSPPQPDRTRLSDQIIANTPTITTTTVSGLSPKHPQYTELAARVGSFIGWTLLEIQDPVELAQAGFFYTGVKDFVRCYYCGVGLKHWERGDNPWTEHSRWSHGCGHLLSSRAAGGSASDTVVGLEVSIPIPPARNNINNGSLLGNNGLDKSASASGSSDMDTAVARSLLDMGYTHEQVQTAMHKYRVENNSKPMTAVALVDILETHQSLEDAASTSPQFQTTGNTSTSEELPSNPSSDVQHSSHQPSIVQSSSYSSSSVDQSHTVHSNTSTENGSTTNNKDETREHSSISEGAKSLLEENRELKSRMQCKICLDRNANMIFLPCGHMVACQTCAVPLRKCAICRKLIKGSVRVYQS